jgi:hypothetical protein
MYKGDSAPACARFGMTQSFVPFQPNTSPAAGLDDAILFGASKPDPGGLPKGTLEYLTFSRFLNVAGEPFQATLHLKGSLKKGEAALIVPPGWTVSAPQNLGKLNGSKEVTFTVTPSATAAVNQNFKISALFTSGKETGYTDNVVRVVSPAEGRFQRWGNWQEYDEWLATTAPQAIRLGRSAAVQSMAVGKTLALPVVVHNWSGQPQSGTVGLTLPSNFTVDATSKPYPTIQPGAETTVTFQLTNTDTALPATQNIQIPITTTYSAPAGSGSETLTLSLVPSTAIAQASSTPVVDGTASPGEYAGQTLDLSRVWQGSCADANDCGDGSSAKVTWSDDALYFFVHVRDDYQSYAVTPEECVGHWQADSVEILLDPRGTASQVLKDTANTFKLGIFPFTNDPANGNGPCWERDADNHQGYSTGPLSIGNAPGVQVATNATWVGSNETTTPHAYAGGGYDLEVKIPLAALPAAVDPARLGLNITPYDNDDTSAAGTTTLRHIDMSTRLGWSALGSVQSDPYRWGQASLSGYTPPADRPTTPAPPNVSNPNLNGALSPQTIAQSARNGVPISGRVPTTDLKILYAGLGPTSLDVYTLAGSPGTARLFLWTGLIGAIPVYTTSCSPTADPAPDYGLTPCAVTDGGYPPWSPDLSGHLVKQTSQQLARGVTHLSIPLTAAQRAKLAADGRLLVSFETAQNQVQAFDVRLSRR